MSHNEIHTAARSWLFTPATRPQRFAKAIECGADVQIVDLEDSVAPADKALARGNALEFLAQPPPGISYALRLNGLDSMAGLADWQAFLSHAADAQFLVMPKVDSAGTLSIADRLLRSAGKTALLIAQVESAMGLQYADELVTATPRLAGLMFGTADMAADLGSDHSWGALQYSRSRLIAAAALRGLLAVDAPYFELSNLRGLEEETGLAVALGFSGKCAIHPSQVEVINKALTPSEKDVAQARAVLRENAKGVGVVDGIMVDEAVARRARRVLSRARQS
jgi:(S)-citramalyl-CoA lyase